MKDKRHADLALLYLLFGRVNGLENVRKFFVAYITVYLFSYLFGRLTTTLCVASPKRDCVELVLASAFALVSHVFQVYLVRVSVSCGRRPGQNSALRFCIIFNYPCGENL